MRAHVHSPRACTPLASPGCSQSRCLCAPPPLLLTTASSSTQSSCNVRWQPRQVRHLARLLVTSCSEGGVLSVRATLASDEHESAVIVREACQLMRLMQPLGPDMMSEDYACSGGCLPIDGAGWRSAGRLNAALLRPPRASTFTHLARNSLATKAAKHELSLASQQPSERAQRRSPPASSPTAVTPSALPPSQEASSSEPGSQE